MMLKISTIEVTPFAQNARFLWDANSTSALAVDPGGDADRLLQFLAAQGLRLEQIWLTHSHLDHCGAVKRLKEVTGAQVFAHPAEAAMRSAVTTICAMYGIPDADVDNCPEPDTYLNGGEVLPFAGREYKVRFTPGHAPGHVVFYCESEKHLLSGDVLFKGSIGRTDLPGGNYNQLMTSIKSIMEEFPGDTTVLPGHGPSTTLEDERKTNPFVRELYNG